MRVPLEWLKEYVTVRLSAEALAERLTMAGHEVVAIHAGDGGPVLDLEITPNRADCLSILGIAREVAALTGQRLKPLETRDRRQETGDKKRPVRKVSGLMSDVSCLKISIEDRSGCQRYIGRLLDGVRVGPSPEWMQRRLLACGARPINNVVDITNYVLFECGQPLHAFDYDRLAEGTIVVRRARPGEPITTLDGVRRSLAAGILVIADARVPVAVAGVMGGAGSEVTVQTTRVLLESALFDPVTVRRTARALGLASESSYRFERGVDPAGVEAASARAVVLLCELAGARDVAVRDVGTKPVVRPAITMEPSRASRWLGVRVEAATARTQLVRLGCRVASGGAGDTLRVTPPSCRRDLAQAADLYEELARLLGYNRIPATLPTSVPRRPTAAPSSYAQTQALKRLCAGLGLTEAITWSLVSEEDLRRVGVAAGQAVRLTNPLTQDHALLRPSLVMGLLQAIRRNATQGASGVRLFELGAVVQPDHAPQERLSLGVAIFGVWTRDWRGVVPADFFRLTGLMDAVCQRWCGATPRASAMPVPWAEAGQSATLTLGDRPLGVVGRVARAILHGLDIEQDVWMGELAAEVLLTHPRHAGRVSPPPPFPPVKRDLSLVVRQDVTAEMATTLIRDTVGSRATRMELIDRFTGTQLPAGTYSLTFSIEYRDPAHTLTAEAADALHRQVGEALVKRLGATLR